MKRVVVTAPDGARWSVRVAWEPRWRAFARRLGGWRRQRKRGRVSAGDVIDVAEGVASIPPPRGRSLRGGGDSDGFDFGDAVSVIALVVIVATAVAALFWWILLPLLLVVVDLLIVVVLLVAALVSRILFGRPWTVEVTSLHGARFTVEVVGWRAALRKRDEMAEAIRLGTHPANLGSVTG